MKDNTLPPNNPATTTWLVPVQPATWPQLTAPEPDRFVQRATPALHKILCNHNKTKPLKHNYMNGMSMPPAKKPKRLGFRVAPANFLCRAGLVFLHNMFLQRTQRSAQLVLCRVRITGCTTSPNIPFEERTSSSCTISFAPTLSNLHNLASPAKPRFCAYGGPPYARILSVLKQNCKEQIATRL